MYIEVHDESQSGILEFDMSKVLSLLAGRCKDLDWYIWEIEAVGSLSLWPSMLALEDMAQKSSVGVNITWPDLRITAQEISEVMNLVLFGVVQGKALPEELTRYKVYYISEVVVEVRDSAYWSVYSVDPDVIVPIEQAFSDVRNKHDGLGVIT